MVNPLDLPEIRERVGQYLSIRELLSCLLVNKDWHCSFLPLIGQQTVVCYNNNGSASSSSSSYVQGNIQLQRQQFQRLDFHCTCPPVTTTTTMTTTTAATEGCRRLNHLKLVSFLSSSTHDNVNANTNINAATDAAEVQTYCDNMSATATLQVWEQMSEFVQRRRYSLLTLELIVGDDQIAHCLWNSISSCARLTSITLCSVTVPESQAAVFWKALSNVERLRLKRTTLSMQNWAKIQIQARKRTHDDDGGIIPWDPALPRLKSLSMFYISGVSPIVQIWLTQNSPELESLTWHGANKAGEFLDLAMLLKNRDQFWRWDNLHSMDLLGHGNLSLSDSVLYKLLTEVMSSSSSSSSSSHGSNGTSGGDSGSSSGVQRLAMPGCVFSAGAFKALTMHHSQTVRELDLVKVLQIKSRMVQQILESFLNLEKISVNYVMAADIVEGKSWGCNRLKLLKTDIVFDELPEQITEQDGVIKDEAKDMNRRQLVAVYKQLGMLDQLEVLDLKTTTAYNPLCPGQWLDLRMEAGLGLLQGLARLRWFMFPGAHQRMGRKEALWMMEHWTGLAHIYGRISPDLAVVDEMEALFQERGIDAQLHE
ncbi:hypothetical protein EDD21DRAFT_95431 [Dissophora ornata]|nr:hypothetical protein EDD21DRAFT_95431 [Dissophora ornata]